LSYQPGSFQLDQQIDQLFGGGGQSGFLVETRCDQSQTWRLGVRPGSCGTGP
jgi:hypothetical protein